MNKPLHNPWTKNPSDGTPSRAIERACLRVAPLFDIRDMVAVNPFLGFTEEGFFEAALAVEQIFHEAVLPPSTSRRDPEGPKVLCVADRAFSAEEKYQRDGPLAGLTKFLGAYFDDSAGILQDSGCLYQDYRSFAEMDRTPEVRGLDGYRALLTQLPEEPRAALSLLAAKLDVSVRELELYLCRLLARLPGYAGYLRAGAFLEEDKLGALPDLLTILLFQDYAIAKLTGDKFGPAWTAAEEGYFENRRERYEALAKKEEELGARLVRRLRVGSVERDVRSPAQLVFCIDVRSERYRRNLERLSEVETYGFAGFFGIPMAVESSTGTRPHCPALLAPQMTLASQSPPSHQSAERAQVKSGFVRALTAPVSSLCTVEAWGLTYSSKLLSDTLVDDSPLPPAHSCDVNLGELSLQKRTQLAQSILKNMGLSFPLAPLVAFIGHDSHVTNNPQAAGLACGACAGHSGSPNAQVAAALLNDREVREALRGTSFEVAEDVLFLAGEHETVTDSVRIIEPTEPTPVQSKLLEELRQSLNEATRTCQKERLAETPGSVGQGLSARTRNPAETQPEWGLAGNAAFLVAQRDLSREVSLSGAAFLHSYDEARDDDGSILEMILTAPAVVTSWINLQYYASTVAPRSFGSGRKTLHNVQSGIGVVEGGQGDLAVGLARESVFRDDEAGAVHEPLRIHVMVQAKAERIREIIERHESLRQLVGGGWIHLSALSTRGNRVVLEPLEGESFRAAERGPVAAE